MPTTVFISAGLIAWCSCSRVLFLQFSKRNKSSLLTIDCLFFAAEVQVVNRVVEVKVVP